MSQTMQCINGSWSVCSGMTDRAAQYGDGVFETIRLNGSGKAPLMARHRQRLLTGLQRLRFSATAIATVAAAIDLLPVPPVGMNGLKILVSRGHTERGYGAPENLEPIIRLQWFDAGTFNAQPVFCGVNPVRLARQPVLAGIKHLNRLEQVLARQAFASGWSESVMLDTQGLITEGTMSNLFMKVDGVWLTPDLSYAGVAGIAREWLLERTDSHVAELTAMHLEQCSALLFCNSLSGIRQVASIDDRLLAASPEVGLWQSEYQALFA